MSADNVARGMAAAAKLGGATTAAGSLVGDAKAQVDNTQKPVSILNYVTDPIVKAALLAGTNTADCAGYIEAALLANRVTDLNGLTLKVSRTIRVAGTRQLFYNGATIDATGMTNPDAPVFEAGYTQAGLQLGATLLNYYGRVLARGSVFRFRAERYDPNLGMGVKALGMTLGYSSDTRRAGSRAFDCRLVDFVEVRGCNIYNLDKAFHFEGISGTADVTTNGTANVTIANSTVPLTAGMVVSRSGIPVGTKILTVNGGGSYTLTASATTSATSSASVYAERACTQILLDENYVGEVNQVGYIAQCDKITVRNTDAMGCGGGWLIGLGNYAVKFEQAHVEAVGQGNSYQNAADIAAGTAKFGWAFYPVDGNTTEGLEFLQCSAYRTTGSAAIGGFYTPRNTRVTVTIMRLCRVEESTSWIPIEFHGAAQWLDKPFPSLKNNIVLGDRDDNFTDIVVNEGAFNPKGFHSLLPGMKAINLRQFYQTGGGTCVIDDDPGNLVAGGTTIDFLSRAHRLTFSGVAEQYELMDLQVGYYTLFLSGMLVSGTVFASVRDNTATPGDSRNFLQRQFNYQTSFERPLRMPFFVDQAGTYRVGIRAGGGTNVALISKIGLFRGFYAAGGMERPAWTVPPVTSLPTASSRYEGDIVTLSGNAYCCTNTSGTYAWKQLT